MPHTHCTRCCKKKRRKNEIGSLIHRKRDKTVKERKQSKAWGNKQKQRLRKQRRAKRRKRKNQSKAKQKRGMPEIRDNRLKNEWNEHPEGSEERKPAQTEESKA